MKNPIITKERINRIIILAKNPIKVPIAGEKENSFLNRNSPSRAPIAGPKITPQNPKTAIPITDPKRAPIIPPFPDLYFLAPKTGAKKSNKEERIENINKTKTVIKEMVLKEVAAA